LRHAEPGDTDFLRRLFASTRGRELEALGADSPLAASFVAMQFAARERSYHSAHPGAVCQVVEPESNGRCEAIGQLWVDIGPGPISLLDISLLPRWRGMGVGSALLRGLLAEAQAFRAADDASSRRCCHGRVARPLQPARLNATRGAGPLRSPDTGIRQERIVR
jgi:GNAT superfamily N-acetyltransferase